MPPQSPRLVPASAARSDYLYREVQPNWSGLFEKLTDLSGSFDPTKWPKALPKIYAALCDLFRLKPKTVSEEVFALVKVALARAVHAVVRDNLRPEVRTLTPIGKDAARRLDDLLQREPVLITRRFFEHPTRASVVGVVARHLASWLRSAGLPADAADATVVVFPSVFLTELAAEFGENADHYPEVAKQHAPKFADLVEAESDWVQYFIKLHTRANPEILDLGVSLDSVYVELRAYTELPLKGTGGADPEGQTAGERDWRPRTLSLLTETAEAWMEDDADAVFVLSGGPGSGKSAFARRFAAWRAWAGPEPWRVVHVPLHRFDAAGDLKSALNEFAAGELGWDHPADLFRRGEPERLLIVFDGLDELAQQGAVGEEVATEFYRRLDSFVGKCNGDDTPVRVKVLVCGRPVAVAQTKAEATRVRHVLPYRIDDELRRRTEWRGQVELSKADQRDEWWEKYGRATGRNYAGLPKDLRTSKLDPLTAEPILNALVARCLRNEGRRVTKETNRALIYEWMLEDVLNRVHDKSGNVIVRGGKTEDIARLLEEVAVTAWHSGDVRATTKSRVRDHCEKLNLTGLLDAVFPDKARSNITPLFLAFYFQEAHERLGQEQAFEFSHKSYGEYLLVRRFRGFLGELQKRLDERAWSDEDALKRWAQLFGPAGLTDELLAFAADAFDLEKPETRNQWRKTMVRLFAAAYTHGMPMEQLKLPTYHEMSRQDRYATLALWGMHSACYRPGDPVYPIEWRGQVITGGTRLSDFLLRLIGHAGYLRTSPTWTLSGWAWGAVDLVGANLVGANLRGANLVGANLRGANLVGANLNAVDLERVDLRGANLGEANLGEANLEGANLEGANLEGANLEGANLVGANLRGANLEGARLERARLERANLVGANLKRVNSVGANLVGANLIRACLIEARLDGADFERANLDWANLIKAHLIESRLGGAHLGGAHLGGAHLGGAHLGGAIISLDQLRETTGDPKSMPNGEPPTKNWRTAKSEAQHGKTTSPEPPTAVPEPPG